jgi:hypothetical protein
LVGASVRVELRDRRPHLHPVVVSAETIPLFPVRHVDPERFAAAQRDLFTGLQLRIGSSSTVHGVNWREWINGLRLPAPACGQGWAGLGAAGELRPTTHAITCLRCRRIAGLDDVELQVALFDLPIPRRSHEPTSSPAQTDSAARTYSTAPSHR